VIVHPDCPGKRPRDGWVYVCTGGGVKRDLIKVGATGVNPSDRVDEFFVSNHEPLDGEHPLLPRPLFSYLLPPNDVMVWAAYTLDRYRDERRVHKALAAYRVREYGREVFATTLPTALQALAEIVSGMIEQYAWGDDYPYGYPMVRPNDPWVMGMQSYRPVAQLSDGRTVYMKVPLPPKD
jgi:hypothetical protein